MDKQSTLFIGGPLDGQWYEVERYLETYRVPLRQSGMPITHLLVDQPSLIYVTYRRAMLHGQKQMWTYFVVETLTVDEGLTQLLQGYQKRRE